MNNNENSEPTNENLSKVGASGKSQKELDNEIKKKKEKQVNTSLMLCVTLILFKLISSQKLLDDIGVIVSMITITLMAVVVVTIKIILSYTEVRQLDTNNGTINSCEQVDASVTTFSPLEQMKGSKIKYTGHGFVPCRG